MTLKDVKGNVGKFSGTGKLSAIKCPTDTTLVPGQEMVCTASYGATAADAQRGSIENTVTASGTSPDGSSTTSDPSTAKAATMKPPPQVLPPSLAQTGCALDFGFVLLAVGEDDGAVECPDLRLGDVWCDVGVAVQRRQVR